MTTYTEQDYEPMTVTIKNGKYIICKDGVYFALTDWQVDELIDLLSGIKGKQNA